MQNTLPLKAPHIGNKVQRPGNGLTGPTMQGALMCLRLQYYLVLLYPLFSLARWLFFSSSSSSQTCKTHIHVSDVVLNVGEVWWCEVWS